MFERTLDDMLKNEVDLVLGKKILDVFRIKFPTKHKFQIFWIWTLFVTYLSNDPRINSLTERCCCV